MGPYIGLHTCRWDRKMTLTRKIAGLLLVVFLFHQSSGVEEFCKSLCTRELGSEKENETRSEILLEACGVGCRMGRLDALIAWPAIPEGDSCLKSCENAFTREDGQWACCIGCNATMRLENDESPLEKETAEATPSIYSSLFSFLYNTFFPSFLSFTNGNSMEITIVTVTGETGSTGDNASEHSYIYIVGSNADNPVAIDDSEQSVMPSNTNGYRLDTDWTEWDDDNDDEETVSTNCHNLWLMLQVISMALIVLSFIFCCLNIHPDEHQREKEITDSKESDFELSQKLPSTTKV